MIKDNPDKPFNFKKGDKVWVSKLVEVKCLTKACNNIAKILDVTIKCKIVKIDKTSEIVTLKKLNSDDAEIIEVHLLRVFNSKMKADMFSTPKEDEYIPSDYCPDCYEIVKPVLEMLRKACKLIPDCPEWKFNNNLCDHCSSSILPEDCWIKYITEDKEGES